MISKSKINQTALSLVNDRISYISSTDTIWELGINDLAVLGEYTCDSIGDDYFLIFVTASGDRYEASFYANERDEFLTKLGLNLGLQLECCLCNSTELNSRVMWPEEITNKPLFKFVPTKANTIVKRIKEWVIPTSEIYFSHDVEEYLAMNINVV